MKMTINYKADIPRKMVSLFSGIGGFELAFQRVGISTTLMCEIDPIAQQILKSNLPNIELTNDICDLERLPEGTDILCAGFPCQDLSSIGVKKGLDGTRSSLVREVFRLLRQDKVEWVIFENVPYMLHLKKGETIRTIVETLEELGYSWAYRTIDSMAFVPQHRCRVFIVASLHNDPKDVLLSGNSLKKQGMITTETFSEPCGFYWTEGKYALGLYQNGIPTLKVGSSIGIASPPAIAFPYGMVASPDIRDAERFQGFPVDWTKPAEDIAKPSARWKLVGNAVTVNTVAWIASKIVHAEQYNPAKDKKLKDKDKWPKAAWGNNGTRYSASVSEYPVERDEILLLDFLKYPCKPLSPKAAKGFEHRLSMGKVRCPQFFRDAIHEYVEGKDEENG
ncbi:DNA cytosine methyltransferase [Caproicibacter sp.]|uniref:DNA cytosine methyltransferase n=1 Tax=Caproicibacter sp. TaxID=2814884 RepID=UPI003988DC3E